MTQVTSTIEIPSVTHDHNTFQGYTQGLPAGFIIERQGKVFYSYYTVTTRDELLGGMRHTTQRFTSNNRILSFDTYEDAYTFTAGFIAMLAWINTLQA